MVLIDIWTDRELLINQTHPSFHCNVTWLFCSFSCHILPAFSSIHFLLLNDSAHACTSAHPNSCQVLICVNRFHNVLKQLTQSTSKMDVHLRHGASCVPCLSIKLLKSAPQLHPNVAFIVWLSCLECRPTHLGDWPIWFRGRMQAKELFTPECTQLY